MMSVHPGGQPWQSLVRYSGGGVSMYDGETFTHFTQKEGLCDNSVHSILEDSHGNLWFGTDGGGVSIV